jgi:hypothetical protein
MVPDNTPLLSIVVPTRNRPSTLIKLLEALMPWLDSSIEVVIQDNSNEPESLSAVNKLLPSLKKNFRYFHTIERLSAVENCDRAIQNSNGIFITFIGDDDGVLPEMLTIVRWMLKEDIDTMCFTTALFTWPDVKHTISINRLFNGKLVDTNWSGTVAFVDPQSEFQRVLKTGAQDLGMLPKVYHGVVRKSCLDRVRTATGSYFPGPVPDMSNAAALTAFTRKHCHLDVPIIISGHSAESMSGKNSRRQHQGEISSELSLPKETEATWDKRIPKFWSGPTIWAQAFLEASRRIGRNDVVKRFNFARVYANCISFCSARYYFRVLVAMVSGQTGLSLIVLVLKTLNELIKISLRRFEILAFKRLRGVDGRSCNDIGEALIIVESAVAKKSLWFPT